MTLKELRHKILSLPKWGWVIIGLSYIIGLILAFTVLIWLPGSTIMTVLLGVALVEWMDNKISKK